jgi:hypothetical protein
MPCDPSSRPLHSYLLQPSVPFQCYLEPFNHNPASEEGFEVYLALSAEIHAPESPTPLPISAAAAASPSPLPFPPLTPPPIFPSAPLSRSDLLLRRDAPGEDPAVQSFSRQISRVQAVLHCSGEHWTLEVRNGYMCTLLVASLSLTYDYVSGLSCTLLSFLYFASRE